MKVRIVLSDAAERRVSGFVRSLQDSVQCGTLDNTRRLRSFVAVGMCAQEANFRSPLFSVFSIKHSREIYVLYLRPHRARTNVKIY